MDAKMKTVRFKVKEYDIQDGCISCVYSGNYDATWLGTSERSARNMLAAGDYSEGGDERRVEVYRGDRRVCVYTAPQIRRFRHRAGTL